MAAKDQRELVRDVLILLDRELCAAGGYVPDDAAQRCRPAFDIDVGEVVNLMSRTLAQLAKWISRLKQAHCNSSCSADAIRTMTANLKRFVPASLKPASIRLCEES
jgi:hypothetical protein